MSRRLLRVLISSLVLFLVGLSPILCPAAHAEKVVALLVNNSSESTSTSNFSENHQRNGSQMAIEQLKKNGVGKSMKFEWVDCGETAQSTLDAFSKIKEMKPDLIVGPSHSFQVEILLKLMKEHRYTTPLVSPTATSSDLLKYDNFFMISNSNLDQSKLLEKAIIENGPQKLLLIEIEDCAYCSNFSREFQKTAKGLRKKLQILRLSESEIKISEKLNGAYGVTDILIPGLEAMTASIIKRTYSKNPVR